MITFPGADVIKGLRIGAVIVMGADFFLSLSLPSLFLIEQVTVRDIQSY